MSRKHTKTKKKPVAWYVSWQFEIVTACLALTCATVITATGEDSKSMLLQDIAAQRRTETTVRLQPRLPVWASSTVPSRSSVQSLKKPRTVPMTMPLGRKPVSSSTSSFHQAAPMPIAPAEGVKRIINDGAFPSFERTVFPVSRVPNWGAMHGAAEWGRTYAQMGTNDFVEVPDYDLGKLMEPFRDAVSANDEEQITRKLFYSTKFFGAYDLDAGEYTWLHPGVDLKLALGTPLGSIAGGRVYAVRNDGVLGLHVLVEHRIPEEGVLYSIYGHLGSVSVQEGDAVKPGQMIGTVGMTGNTSAPHIHLQIDRKRGTDPHVPYRPDAVPSQTEAGRWTVHPIRFIQKYANG